MWTTIGYRMGSATQRNGNAQLPTPSTRLCTSRILYPYLSERRTMCLWTVRNITTNWNSVFWIASECCSQTTTRQLPAFTQTLGAGKSHFPWPVCVRSYVRCTLISGPQRHSEYELSCRFVRFRWMNFVVRMHSANNAHRKKNEKCKTKGNSPSRWTLFRSEKENSLAKGFICIISEAEAHRGRRCDLSREQYWI